jgi:ribonuclease E
VLPVTADENRRIEVFERELWRIAVEHLDYGEQVQWAALAGARVAPAGWRRARAMLHFDQGGELKRTFLLTAVERNKNPQLRLRALTEIAASKDAEAFDRALDFVEGWPRDDKREGVKVVLQALAEKKIGRRDQANNWIWRCANLTREVHEEYAVQRWPETKRLLGLLVNSSGGAHARNARRLVHAARQQDRRLSAALLAAALPHTAEAGEVINGARTRMSRKPAALARELLRNFPKGGKGRRSSRRRRKKGAGESQVEAVATTAAAEEALTAGAEEGEQVAAGDGTAEEAPKPKRRRAPRKRAVDADPGDAAPAPEEPVADEPAAEEKPKRRRAPRKKPATAEAPAAEASAPQAEGAEAPAKPKRATRSRAKKPPESPPQADAEPKPEAEEKPKPKPKRAPRARKSKVEAAVEAKSAVEAGEPAAKPKRPSRARKKPAAAPSPLEAATERVRAAVEGAAGDEAA